MKPIKLTEELRRVAQRCVWFKAPEEAVAYPEHFIAHVLTFGTHEDVKALRRHVSDEDLKEAIDKAPPGVFDARSWAYWNLIIGRAEAPPMPRRVFS
ncbi:MAG: hypothetical protein ACM31O_16975 [Bacteroidota bacterium]